MLFNSYIFVFLFFPLCLTGYFGLNHFKHYRLAQGFLFCMSLWFYGFFNPSYLPIIIISILLNYGFVQLMNRTSGIVLKKLELIAALLINLGILFYYKYFDFFIENLNFIFRTDFTLHHILLPLGISFFTFQQISYLVDAYRGEVQNYDFLQYASFVAYFPQLIAGPIVTHDELVPQFADLSKKRFCWEHFASGLYLFVLGLSKKVLIADLFGNAANWGFSHIDQLDSTSALFSILSYTIQIYFDFSGYCDMSIGIGRTMNIDLPVNFDSPYKALTITDFWHRWHKTLTRFFTKYIYIPLGGNRKGNLRTYCNIMIVFLVSGLWHGASWNFILWGFLHGAFLVLTRWRSKQFQQLHPALSWGITFGFLNFSWIFFRAANISDALHMIHRVLTLNFQPLHVQLIDVFGFERLLELFRWLTGLSLNFMYPNMLVLITVLLIFILLLGSSNTYEKFMCFRPCIRTFLITWLLLVLCILSFSNISTFLYFNF